MTEYQKNQTTGKDPQVIWILEPLFTSFKITTFRKIKGKK